MPIDLRELLDPRHTALVAQECQNGVIGEQSAIPDLAAACRDGLIPNVAALARQARAVGAQVIHCTAATRADRKGQNHNARLFNAGKKAPVQLLPGSSAVEVVPEIGVEPSDLELTRYHGLSPFQGTELDSFLRNLEVRTVIAVGVSVNMAIMNLTFDAVNAAYQVVIPRDAVAGWPQEYVDMVFANTLGAVATICTTADVLEAWSA